MTIFVDQDNPTRGVRNNKQLYPKPNADGDMVHVTTETDDKLLNSVGWWRVVETAPPPVTETQTWRSRIIPSTPGPGYEIEWYHDDDAHTARLDNESRLQDRVQLRSDISTLRDIARDNTQLPAVRQLARISLRIIRGIRADD